MKQNVSGVLLLTLAVGQAACFAQSSFLFRNLLPSYGIDAPVFDSDGNRLSGPNYVAVLYGGPTPDALSIAWDGYQPGNTHPMPVVPFTYMPLGRSGYFTYSSPDGGAGVVIPNVECGRLAWLQVRAWDVRLGASYEDVVSLGLGGYGESALFLADGGDPCALGQLPGPLIGLQSFSLRAVIPEPSPALLLLLGLPLLLVRRRRSG